MSITNIIFVALCVFACPLSSGVLMQTQDSVECVVERLEISDHYLVAWGDDLTIYAKGQCMEGTSHLTVSANMVVVADGQDTELWATLHTQEFAFGQLDVCATVTAERNAIDSYPEPLCETVWLVDSNALDE